MVWAKVGLAGLWVETAAFAQAANDAFNQKLSVGWACLAAVALGHVVAVEQAVFCRD